MHKDELAQHNMKELNNHLEKLMKLSKIMNSYDNKIDLENDKKDS